MLLLKHSFSSVRKFKRWIAPILFKLLIGYRQTFGGLFWMYFRPLCFIAIIGILFAGLSSVSLEEFIPHLAVGYIFWTLLGGYLTGSFTVFERSKPLLFSCEYSHTDAVLSDHLDLLVKFLHLSILIVAVVLYFKTIDSPYFLMSFLGLFIVMVTGFFFTIIVGTIGSRFKDLGEFSSAITRVVFLATPIIWIPGGFRSGSRRRQLVAPFVDYNPFYHYLELMRAPLLGNEITTYTWTFVGVSTTVVVLTAILMYRRFAHLVVFWIT
ncbi:MAG: ABC transporter permease [Hyphomonadaceae bacterium]|nr:ABC transporter permease [Hyphomonadaceae bacterium]MBC6412926.1 ABC transporter permease [Hyphomonadaceae bacterium]